MHWNGKDNILPRKISPSIDNEFNRIQSSYRHLRSAVPISCIHECRTWKYRETILAQGNTFFKTFSSRSSNIRKLLKGPKKIFVRMKSELERYFGFRVPHPVGVTWAHLNVSHLVTPFFVCCRWKWSPRDELDLSKHIVNHVHCWNRFNFETTNFWIRRLVHTQRFDWAIQNW